MKSSDEVIALLLAERDGAQTGRVAFSPGAQRLIRDREGRIALEPVETRRDFEETARTTGCFRRGKAIRDPRTREVIGYEMEEVALGAGA